MLFHTVMTYFFQWTQNEKFEKKDKEKNTMKFP